MLRAATTTSSPETTCRSICPGNGTLLLAVAMMCAGYEGCDSPTPGFPKDGSWTVRWENLMALPDQTQGVDSR